MNDNTRSRREVLANAALGMAAGIGAIATLAPRTAAAASPTACGGMTRERYMEYVNLFNANDPRFIEFYHPDVELELSNQVIKGATGIRDFYAQVKAHIKEKVEVTHYIADATGIATVLPTEFRVYKDWGADNFFKRALKAGEVMRTISFGIYWVENGKFKSIKTARYRQINDWRMEG